MQNNVTDLELFKAKCNEIVTHLVECRRSAGLTQNDLADWVGVYRAKINRFEKGEFDYALMFTIADKFGVRISLDFTPS